MVQETEVQSQIKSYQRLKKWHLMLTYLTLHLDVVAIEKGDFGLSSTMVG